MHTHQRLRALVQHAAAGGIALLLAATFAVWAGAQTHEHAEQASDHGAAVTAKATAPPHGHASDHSATVAAAAAPHRGDAAKMPAHVDAPHAPAPTLHGGSLEWNAHHGFVPGSAAQHQAVHTAGALASGHVSAHSEAAPAALPHGHTAAEAPQTEAPSTGHH